MEKKKEKKSEKLKKAKLHDCALNYNEKKNYNPNDVIKIKTMYKYKTIDLNMLIIYRNYIFSFFVKYASIYIYIFSLRVYGDWLLHSWQWAALF